MLNRHQLKDYRLLRGITVREVANYSDISFSLVTQVENGDKEVTPYNHREIIRGINAAYVAKKNGTLLKGDQKKKKADSELDSEKDSENKESENKDAEKKAPKKKTTTKKSNSTKRKKG